MISIGIYAGLGAGAILTLVAHIAPRFSAGNFIRDIDQPMVFGKKISRREAHLIGVLVHLVLCVVYGGLFAYAVERSWFSGFTLIPIFIYSVILTLFTGLVVMPLEGHGWFGIKNDTWFGIDVFVTNILWGLLYLLLIRLWLPV